MYVCLFFLQTLVNKYAQLNIQPFLVYMKIDLNGFSFNYITNAIAISIKN